MNHSSNLKPSTKPSSTFWPTWSPRGARHSQYPMPRALSCTLSICTDASFLPSGKCLHRFSHHQAQEVFVHLAGYICLTEVKMHLCKTFVFQKIQDIYKPSNPSFLIRQRTSTGLHCFSEQINCFSFILMATIIFYPTRKLPWQSCLLEDSSKTGNEKHVLSSKICPFYADCE